MLQAEQQEASTVAIDGREFPLINISDVPTPPLKIARGGAVYTYTKSYPLKGYGAIFPQDAEAFINEGRQILLARRGDRLYVYLTGGTGATKEDAEAEA